jgi:ABC-2 type transport system permease protein
LYSFLACTFTLFIVALAVVAESGNVIFNEAEVDVIGHLPVSSRTLFVAKVLNLLSFSMLLAAASNLFPALAGIWAVRSNWMFVFAHTVSTALMGLFSTSLIVATYGLLMRYVSRQRFDSIIAYCQAALGIVFLLAYQLLPRLIDREQIATADFKAYYAICPPAWFSAITMLLIGETELQWIGLSAAAVGSLFILGSFALRKVGSGYSAFSSQLAFGSGSLVKKGGESEFTAAVRVRRQSLWETTKGRVLSPVERAVFDLVAVYLRRDREIKVRLYPQLAYFVVFPLVAMFTDGLPDPFISSKAVFSVLMGPAMICFVALTAIEGIAFSEHYHAAYIFQVAPIDRLGDVHGGIRKAILLMVTTPAFIILFVIYAVLWGDPSHAFFVLAPWIAVSPTVMLVPFLFRRVLPLSRKYQKGQQSARSMAIFIGCMGGLSVIGVAQSLAMKARFSFWFMIVAATAGSAVLFFLLKRISRESSSIRPADDTFQNGKLEITA